MPVVEPAGRRQAESRAATHKGILTTRLRSEPPKLITFASGNPSPLAQDDICWVESHVPSHTIHCGRSKLYSVVS